MRDTARRLIARVDRGPIGVILAGGRGRRIGGAKAIVELRGPAALIA